MRRPLRLGALCSPQLDQSIQNFSFPEMRASLLEASKNPNIAHSIVAVVANYRENTMAL